MLSHRFIPAGAGNTGVVDGVALDNAVYPRWRGEHLPLPTLKHLKRGLSPLARGTRYKGKCILKPFRFIPAGAGNTQACALAANLTTVYPRWRGEHMQLIFWLGVITGLSPLARGTLGAADRGNRQGRFIPAGAGNTARRYQDGNVNAVYPRWRGEHRCKKGCGQRGSGLSPLARGTRNCAFSSATVQRFIPAGAGNTIADGHDKKWVAVYPRWRGEHSDTG